VTAVLCDSSGVAWLLVSLLMLCAVRHDELRRHWQPVTH